ncbi:MAG: di-heme oxidoredictase family protein [Nitrospirales bacterium]
MRNISRTCLGICGSILIVAAGCNSIASRSDQPLADQRNLIDEVRYSQDDINQNNVPFEDLFYAGKHIFSNRFTTEDHYGEGPDGPRRSKYAMANRTNYPFLRFNGLDSQSCLECHLAVGFAPQKNYPDNTANIRFAKQLGFTGGGAGFASSAFGFDNFACFPDSESCEPDNASNGVIRNPPHAFGAGYTQTLAEEMTWDLQEKLAEAKASPGESVELVTKGVAYGHIVADAGGNVDVSNVQGISGDLVVRPFQWRGIASNLRNFIRDAMNFHFSVQPKEFLEINPGENDQDGKKDEILEGDISAVATYLAFLRPPTESSDGLDAQMVNQGRRAFMKADCASCHVPSLRIDSPYATIRDPRTDQSMKAKVALHSPSIPAKTEALQIGGKVERFGITSKNSVSPSLEKYLLKKGLKAKKLSEENISEDMIAKEIVLNLKGYSRNLNLENGPPETLPRLPHTNGGVEVPLYSDLKRHNMGDKLEEPITQKTDGGHDIPLKEYLTRPLWGVADTAPWMHDGRALTLTDAILMHEGKESEANDSVEKFNNLSDHDKLALRTFLSSLRLPTVHYH